MSIAKVITEKKKLWTCPKCKRQFQRHGQLHSCRPYPLSKHFERRPIGKLLYDTLKQAIKNDIGPFKVESLQCCIHFVHTTTFAAVKIFNDKIRVDFCLSYKIKSNRITHFTPMSANRYLYCVDVLNEDEIDKGLLTWIHEALDK
jgi:hypothetical protein